MVAIAQITNVNFPLRMPGDPITGTVILTNIGNEPTSESTGFFGVLIKTLWDGQEYPLFMYSTTAPGETVTFNYSSLGTMPDGYAKIEVTGRTWLGAVWRVDDVKSWDLSEGVPPPEYPPPYPNPLLPLLLIAAVALLFFGRK